jgi:hypothetical protein
MYVSLRKGALMRTEMATFNVVEIPYAYKVIFKRGIIINRFTIVIQILTI